jgi:exodeoxyribonuclease VII large subunit
MATISPSIDPGLETLTLSEFLTIAQRVIQSVPEYWIEADIADIKQHSGNYYLSLSENDFDSGNIAKIEARIWKSTASYVLSKFNKLTNDSLKKGMRIRVRVKASIHIKHGFSVVIQDIDPEHTLGNIELQRIKIREALMAQNIYQNNKINFCTPQDFFRIAVISPEVSHALADFREVADTLSELGLCEFDYFGATFQGIETANSIFEQMKAVMSQHKTTPYCALCLIRGGGSSSDLAELDRFKLAHAICSSRVPVFTGIGHEPNHGSLDEVAHQKFDTPSKVALHIKSTIVNTTRETEFLWSSIRPVFERSLERSRSQNNTDFAFIKNQAYQSVLKEQNTLHEYAYKISDSSEILLRHNFDLKTETDSIKNSIDYKFESSKKEINQEFESLKTQSQTIIKQTRASLEQTVSEVLGLSPQRTLKRGFAYVTNQDKKPVTTVQKARASEHLTVHFTDGNVETRIYDSQKE